MKNAFDIVRDFEQAVAEYTGAPYCVAVNSCTNALFLALIWAKDNIDHDWANNYVEIPKHTYVSVPMQIKHAGLIPRFREENWIGAYSLEPYPIWDSARAFTSNLFNEIPNKGARKFICVSFHWSKILGVQQGGAILHNDPKFDEWARRAR